MAISNYGSGIIVDKNGGSINNLNLSNVNIQDNTIYTVTSLKDSSDTNGDIVLTKMSGYILNLESRHTFLCKSAYILNSTINDPSITKIETIYNKVDNFTSKINSIDSINEEINKIKTITKKPHGTKIG